VVVVGLITTYAINTCHH